MDQTKTCTKCKAEKPVEEFSKNKKTASGLQSWCRACTRAAVAARNPNSPRRPRRRLASGLHSCSLQLDRGEAMLLLFALDAYRSIAEKAAVDAEPGDEDMGEEFAEGVKELQERCRREVGEFAGLKEELLRIVGGEA